MSIHTSAHVGSLLPISDMPSQILFWTLFLCNLSLFHLHTPGGTLDKTKKGYYQHVWSFNSLLFRRNACWRGHCIVHCRVQKFNYYLVDKFIRQFFEWIIYRIPLKLCFIPEIWVTVVFSMSHPVTVFADRVQTSLITQPRLNINHNVMEARKYHLNSKPQQ